MAGALVPRQEEIQSVTTPLTIIILASFFLCFGALDDPDCTLAHVLSLMPPSAPMVMPVRLIAGDVPAWEVDRDRADARRRDRPHRDRRPDLRRGVLRTGSRVKLRAVWRATSEQAAIRR